MALLSGTLTGATASTGCSRARRPSAAGCAGRRWPRGWGSGWASVSSWPSSPGSAATSAQPSTALPLPGRPIWLYRVTQGLHVAAGTAAVPCCW